MFTQDNTQGYTNKQLKAANEELARCLHGVDDPAERADIEKAFSDSLDDFVVGLTADFSASR